MEEKTNEENINELNEVNYISNDKKFYRKYKLIKEKFKRKRDKNYEALKKKWDNIQDEFDKSGLFLIGADTENWKKNQNTKLLEQILKKIKPTNFNYLNLLFNENKITDDNLYFLNEEQMKDSLIEYNNTSKDEYKKHKFLLDLNDTLQYIYKHNQLNEKLNEI